MLIIPPRKGDLSIQCLEMFKLECKQPRRSVGKGTSGRTDKVTKLVKSLSHKGALSHKL